MSARGVTLGFLARPALLAVWALVLWGSLLLAVALVELPIDGLRTVLARLVPRHGASAWAWLNLLTAALALFVWLLAGGVLLWSRRSGQNAPRS